MVCHGLVVPRIGTIGDFHGVAKPVPVVVGIEMVLDAVSVQVLHYVCNVDDEGLCQRGVVLVCCLCAYVQGCGVCLVVEGCGGSEGAVGVQGEEVVVLRTIAVGEGQDMARVGVGIGYREVSDYRSFNLILGD